MSTHPTSKEGEAILRDLPVETRHLPSPMWHTHIHTCTGSAIHVLCQQSIHMHCCIIDIAFWNPVSPSGLWGQRAPHQPRSSQDSPCITPLLGSDFYYTQENTHIEKVKIKDPLLGSNEGLPRGVVQYYTWEKINSITTLILVLSAM